jgi:hypothetical protein
MSFFRRQEVDVWFNSLHKDKSLELQFDDYYMCLMIGFAALRDDPLQGGIELVRHFPGQYGSASKLVVGLLLIAETKKLGKQLGNKRDVEFLVQQYLESSGSGALNDAGFDRLNDYANGGFNYMVEEYDKPYHADAFFGWYTERLRSLAAESPLWSSQNPITL